MNHKGVSSQMSDPTNGWIYQPLEHSVHHSFPCIHITNVERLSPIILPLIPLYLSLIRGSPCSQCLDLSAQKYRTKEGQSEFLTKEGPAATDLPQRRNHDEAISQTAWNSLSPRNSSPPNFWQISILFPNISKCKHLSRLTTCRELFQTSYIY